MIFGFILATKDFDTSLHVTTTNKKIKYKVYQNHTPSGLRSNFKPCAKLLPLSTIITKENYDEKGEYFVFHKVFRPTIDATLLRVCKSINTQATKLLYGNNVFQFLMREIGERGEPNFLGEDKLDLYSKTYISSNALSCDDKRNYSTLCRKCCSRHRESNACFRVEISCLSR